MTEPLHEDTEAGIETHYALFVQSVQNMIFLICDCLRQVDIAFIITTEAFSSALHLHKRPP